MDIRSTLDRLIQQRSVVERELVALHQQQQTHDGADVDPSEQSATNTEKVTFNLAVATSRVHLV